MNNGTRFTAGANGLPEIESSAKFRSDRDATSVVRKALRSMAYENQDSGWSKFRCHARVPGLTLGNVHYKVTPLRLCG